LLHAAKLARSIAGWATTRLGARLGANPATASTLLPAWNLDRFFGTKNGFLEGQRDIDVEVSTPLSTPTAGGSRITKKGLEDFVEAKAPEVGVASVGPSKPRLALMAILVVLATTLLIAQDFVGFVNLFKFCFGIRTCVSIRVQLESKFTKGTADFVLGRVSVYSQNFIVIALCRHYCSSIRV
jgi:hypothetical protein